MSILTKTFAFLYKFVLLWWKISNPLTLGVRILLIKENQVLLIKHTYREGYYPPGGGINYGESAEQAIRREYSEEIGGRLGEIKIHSVLSDFTEKQDYVVTFISNDFEPEFINNIEILESKFYDIDKLPADLNSVFKDPIIKLVKKSNK